MEISTFRLEQRRDDPANMAILTPHGRITLGQSVREMRQAFDQLASEGCHRVLVNMSDVPYVDSAGLGALVSGLTQFKKAGGILGLVDVQPRIAQLLDLTNLTTVMPTFPTEGAARESLQA